MIKRTYLKDFKVSRYNKPIVAIKLKEDDKLIGIESINDPYIFVATYNGYGLSYNLEEVPVTGLKTSGVKSISLKNDFVVSSHIFGDDYEYLTVITNKNTAKRVKLTEFSLSSRARRGSKIIKEVKTNPYQVLKTFIIDNKDHIGIKNGEINIVKETELPISDRYSTGKELTKHGLTDAFVIADLETKENFDEDSEIEEVSTPKKEQVDLKEIDDRLMTIDDFLN